MAPTLQASERPLTVFERMYVERLAGNRHEDRWAGFVAVSLLLAICDAFLCWGIVEWGLGVQIVIAAVIVNGPLLPVVVITGRLSRRRAGPGHIATLTGGFEVRSGSEGPTRYAIGEAEVIVPYHWVRPLTEHSTWKSPVTGEVWFSDEGTGVLLTAGYVDNFYVPPTTTYLSIQEDVAQGRLVV